MRPAAFLDRDGVLNAPVIRNGKPYPPASAEDVIILDGVQQACKELKQAGLLLIGVTNQPDIARGTASADSVGEINALVARRLGMDTIVVCPHDDPDDCACRKPRPGMILDAARRWNVDLSRSTMVGDRWRDIEAGKAAGVATVLVERRYDERKAEAADLVVDSLAAAVDWITQRARAGSGETK
jgi:D-glycero-D-manno-heptose 1,7-bisphosphate phosphatase